MPNRVSVRSLSSTEQRLNDLRARKARSEAGGGQARKPCSFRLPVRAWKDPKRMHDSAVSRQARTQTRSRKRRRQEAHALLSTRRRQ